MLRPTVWKVCALALGLCFVAGCNPKAKARVKRNVSTLGKKVSSATETVKDGLSESWEVTKTTTASWAEAAKHVDAARNGCTLERRMHFDLDPAEEYFVGRSLAAEHIAQLGAPGLGRDHPVSRYVDQVGQYLVLASDEYGESNVAERWKDYVERTLPNRPSAYAGYHFIVLDRAEPNAFGGPGGAILITTGLLEKLESEEELAAVLAHEIAHVQRGHGVEIVKAFLCHHAAQEKAFEPLQKAQAGAEALKQKLPPGFALSGLGADVLDELMTVLHQKMQSLYTVGYPRGFELEADRIALRYMALAGYDPEAMVRLFDRLQAASGGHDEYGQTHPRFDTRKKVVRPVIDSIPAARRPDAEAIAPRDARFKAAMAKLPRRPAPPRAPPATATR